MPRTIILLAIEARRMTGFTEAGSDKAGARYCDAIALGAIGPIVRSESDLA